MSIWQAVFWAQTESPFLFPEVSDSLLDLQCFSASSAKLLAFFAHQSNLQIRRPSNRHQNEINRVLTLIDTVVSLEASRVKFPLPKQKSHFEVGPALLDPFEVSLRQATPVRVSSLRPGSGESLDLFRLSLSQQTSTGHPKLP